MNLLTSPPIRCAALNTGTEFQTLDHIAPLAALVQMPLITTEARHVELTRKYYPGVEVRYLPSLETELGAIAEEFDALFECKYWQPQLKLLFQQLFQKEMRLVFCPHGQSDKGYHAPVLAPYGIQDRVLLYGELLIDMLKELSVWPSISRYALVGNYRLAFYQKHKAFYDALMQREIPLDPQKPTVLYAPTWRDVDEETSFFEYGKKVIAELPEGWNLIIKPHPFLEQRDPVRFYTMASLAHNKPNIFFLNELPLVYPVLALADIFLGDFSSVGYDALHFDLPLYFFPAKKPGRLHACGRVLNPDRNLYSQLERSHPFSEEQKKLFTYAFGSKFKETSFLSAIDQLLKNK